MDWTRSWPSVGQTRHRRVPSLLRAEMVPLPSLLEAPLSYDFTAQDFSAIPNDLESLTSKCSSASTRAEMLTLGKKFLSGNHMGVFPGAQR